MTDVSFPPDYLLELWTTRIRDGERGKEVDELARVVLRDFYLRQCFQQPHSQVTLNWLADVIYEVLEHADVRELLGLMPRPKHRPKNPTHPRSDVAIWLDQAQKRGYGKTEAIELASEVFAKDVKTIERYLREAGPMLERVNPNASVWENYFVTRSPPRPLPPERNTNLRVPVSTRRAQK